MRIMANFIMTISCFKSLLALPYSLYLDRYNVTLQKNRSMKIFIIFCLLCKYEEVRN